MRQEYTIKMSREELFEEHMRNMDNQSRRISEVGKSTREMLDRIDRRLEVNK